jgi:hypothetical protein
MIVDTFYLRSFLLLGLNDMISEICARTFSLPSGKATPYQLNRGWVDKTIDLDFLEKGKKIPFSFRESKHNPWVVLSLDYLLYRLLYPAIQQR